MTPSRWMSLACLAGFLAIATAAISGASAAWDTALLEAFRDAGDLSVLRGPLWTVTVLRDLTALGGVTVLSLIVFCAAALFMWRGQRSTAARLIGAVVSGQLLSNGLKALLDRARPDLVPHETLVTSASFPSGHSMMAMLIWLTLALNIAATVPQLRRPLVAAALLIAGLVGVSRVALGVHWPSDVLGGWALGAACALLWAPSASGRRG